MLTFIYARVATDAEKNALDWQTAANWQKHANLSKGYFDSNPSVQANKAAFDNVAGPQQVKLGERFVIPDAAKAWFNNPHQNKLVIQKNNIYLESDIGNALGTLTDAGNAGREMSKGKFTTLSNYWSDMHLKLPSIKFAQQGSDIEFEHLDDQKQWIEWHSIEAMFQAFKVFITKAEDGAFSWKAWANKVPDAAKGAGQHKGQGANDIIKKKYTGTDQYKMYQHRLFRFVCAAVAIKFLTDPKLAQELVNIEGWILELVKWDDQLWGGKDGVASYHKLGWILMNVREMLRLRQTGGEEMKLLLEPKEVPEFFAAIYNARWLFPGDDSMSNQDENSFLVDNTGKKIEATNEFGLVSKPS